MTLTAVEEQAIEEAANNALRPCCASIPDGELVELRRRIKATRWPERETVPDASQGVQLATMQALARRWGIGVEPITLARLALAAEVTELGITAGLIDRAVQALRAPALVDGDVARRLAVNVLPPLVVAWRADAAGPSHRVHGALRRRFDAGEGTVVTAMQRLADAGRAGAAALESGDADAFAQCVRTTWAQRQTMGIVGDDVAAMVDAFDQHGVAATSAGSGGAVVGVLPPTVDAAQAMAAIDGIADDAVTLP